MKETAAGMRFEKFWPEAIVVYLQGLPTNPSADPQGYGWIYNPGHDGDRDLKFFDAVLATLREKFPVDNRRIYATGFSNGGMFTYVLWGTRPNVFAAFASVAGRIVPAVHLTEPKPILHVAGEEDTTVPFKDQLQAIKTARELNGASKEGTACGKNCTTYPSSKGTPVVTYIHAGGHEYPPGTSEMIVKFFEGQSLAH
jgi:polyhydroxybutyrate depolymerase